MVWKSVYTSIALRCGAALHSLHSDCGVTALRCCCGVTALWCRNKVKFILTWNAVRYIELWQKAWADPHMVRIGTGPPFWQTNHANSAYFRLFLGYFRVISATRPPLLDLGLPFLHILDPPLERNQFFQHCNAMQYYYEGTVSQFLKSFTPSIFLQSKIISYTYSLSCIYNHCKKWEILEKNQGICVIKMLKVDMPILTCIFFTF